MQNYELYINGVKYTVLVEKYKERILIHINNKVVFDVDYIDSASDKYYFYKIIIDDEEVIVSIKYHIPSDGIKVAYSTNCYINGKSIVDGDDINETKDLLITKTCRGFRAYAKENGLDVIKNTVKEMTLSTIFGWGIILFGIKKYLLMILIMPLWAFLVGISLIAVSYFAEKSHIKKWDEQYKATVDLNEFLSD